MRTQEALGAPSNLSASLDLRALGFTSDSEEAPPSDAVDVPLDVRFGSSTMSAWADGCGTGFGLGFVSGCSGDDTACFCFAAGFACCSEGAAVAFDAAPFEASFFMGDFDSLAAAPGFEDFRITWVGTNALAAAESWCSGKAEVRKGFAGRAWGLGIGCCCGPWR